MLQFTTMAYEDVSVNLNERLHEKIDKWSTAKLFRLEVLDERLTDKGDKLYVHYRYVGWATQLQRMETKKCSCGCA